MVLQFFLWESRTLPGIFYWEERLGIEIEKDTLKEKIDNLVKWIREKTKDAGKKGVIYGLSGGIDSAVIAVLCEKAFPDSNLALILPCESISSDIDDAMEIINKYNIDYKNINLTPIYNQLLSTMANNDNKLAKANIKPRLRMIVLYYFANMFDYLVVGTGNKSEISIGYFTKYGDGGVDILPLGNIYKTEVKMIARYLDIPEALLNKPPSAGLWKNQTDEKEMGFSYEILDKFLATGMVDNKRIEKNILKMNQLSEHKRKLPPIPNL